MSDNTTVLLVDDDLDIVRAARLRLVAAGSHGLPMHVIVLTGQVDMETVRRAKLLETLYFHHPVDV